MAGKLLTTQSQLRCPHGGTVSAVSGGPVMAGAGARVLVQTDACTVAGCPFQLPAPSGTVPSPCVRVQWIIANAAVRVNGIPTLSESSVGVCLSALQAPQGTVVVVSTQPAALAR